MAGQGSRFTEAGYDVPKPFLPLGGKPMISAVIDNICTPADRVFLIHRPEHAGLLGMLPRPCSLHSAAPHKGAAEAVLQLASQIDSNHPLLIANSDQWVDFDVMGWMDVCAASDAAMMVFECPEKDKRWSYARVGSTGRVIEVAEKVPISTLATVGVYYFKRGADFCRAALSMRAKNIRLNGELYVCPAFNELVHDIVIKTFKVKKMYGMGTPEDYEANKPLVEAIIKR